MFLSKNYHNGTELQRCGEATKCLSRHQFLLVDLDLCKLHATEPAELCMAKSFMLGSTGSSPSFVTFDVVNAGKRPATCFSFFGQWEVDLAVFGGVGDPLNPKQGLLEISPSKSNDIAEDTVIGFFEIPCRSK